MRRFQCFAAIRRFSTNPYLSGRYQAEAMVNQLQKHIQVGNIERFCKDLKNFSVKRPSSLSLTLLDRLFTPELISKLDAKLTSEVIWSLGGLGYSAKYPEKRAILIELLRHSFRISANGRTSDITILWNGLKLYNLKFRLLDADIRIGLLSQVEAALPMMNASEISRFSHAALKCFVHWGYFSPQLREKFLSRMLSQQHHFTVVESCLTVMSLGHMHMDLNEESGDIQEAVIGFVIETFRKYCADAADHSELFLAAMRGLYLMGKDFSFLNQREQSVVKSALYKLFTSVHSEDLLSQTFLWLGRFGVKWSDLDSSTHTVILRSLISLLPSMTEKELTQTFFGLAQMNPPPLTSVASSSSFSSSSSDSNDARMRLMHSTALQAVETVFSKESRAAAAAASEGEQQSISKIVYALGRFGVSYSDGRCVSALSKVLLSLRRNPPLNDIDISQLLSGLKALGVKWNSLDESVRNVINGHLTMPGELSGRQESRLTHTLTILDALSGLNVLWDEVQHSKLEANIIRLKEQLDAKSLYVVWSTLCGMEARWSSVSLPLTKSLLDLIPTHVSSWSVEEVAQVMQSLMLLSFDYAAQFETDPSAVNLKDVAMREALLAAHTALLSHEGLGKNGLSGECKSRVMEYAAYLRCTHQTHVSLMDLLNTCVSNSDDSQSHIGEQNHEDLLKLLSVKYTVKTSYSALPYQVYPVDLCLLAKESSQSKAFINIVDDSIDAYGQRKTQLQKFLYASVAPDVPLLNIKASDAKKMAKHL